VSTERNRLRATFDEAALLYEEVRPGYPEELFDDMVSLRGIPAGGRILEIGCGMGRANVPFARPDYRIVCVELGENLDAVARRNLEAYPQAEVYIGPFEQWHLQDAAFNLAVSATASHWLDPEVLARRSRARSKVEDRSPPCFGTCTSTRTRTEASSRGRRGSTSEKRPRSSVPTTTRVLLGQTRFPAGPRRSRVQACLKYQRPGNMVGTKRTTQRAT
jgi:SAM-dependent methyltransferase